MLRFTFVSAEGKRIVFLCFKLSYSRTVVLKLEHATESPRDLVKR